MSIPIWRNPITPHRRPALYVLLLGGLALWRDNTLSTPLTRFTSAFAFV